MLATLPVHCTPESALGVGQKGCEYAVASKTLESTQLSRDMRVSLRKWRGDTVYHLEAAAVGTDVHLSVGGQFYRFMCIVDMAMML